DPVLNVSVTDAELTAALYLDDRHQRVHGTVSVFTEKILEAEKSEDAKPEIWFVVVPDMVYEYCRPKSTVATELQIKATRRLKPRMARKLRTAPSLFPDENQAAVPYHYDVDFHNQLKARLLGPMVLTQVIRESTIYPAEDITGF